MLSRKYPALLILTVVALLTALPVTAQDIADKPDDSWVSISGTVVEPLASTFLLDYGKGLITVEMDEFETYGEAHALFDGDRVVVRGRIDNDFYEAKTIEAKSVYVDGLNTYFYASSADEELSRHWHVVEPVVVSQTTVRGTVTAIDQLGEEFTIDQGSGDLIIDVQNLGYNPLDDYGFQQIDEGDRISATGDLDQEFLNGQVLHADTVVNLSN